MPRSHSFSFVAVVVSLLSALIIASPALAEDSFEPVSIEQLASTSTPEDFEGRVTTGGYLQFVGYFPHAEYDGAGDNEYDVLAVTYRLWTNKEFTGTSYIYVVIVDKNSEDLKDSPPSAPIIAEGAFYRLEGKWEESGIVSSPELVPGAKAWALRAYGFD